MKKHKMTINFFYSLFAILFFSPSTGISQITQNDSLALMKIINVFEESIIQKDSVRFNKLFFSNSVDFIGIMSKESERSIKKNYAEFQGLAVSDHKGFIKNICKSEKKEKETFYNIEASSDSTIGSISFDYAFLSNEKMIQWGHEKWNLVKINEEWLITNVVYSIHFPTVEAFPFN